MNKPRYLCTCCCAPTCASFQHDLCGRFPKIRKFARADLVFHLFRKFGFVRKEWIERMDEFKRAEKAHADAVMELDRLKAELGQHGKVFNQILARLEASRDAASAPLSARSSNFTRPAEHAQRVLKDVEDIQAERTEHSRARRKLDKRISNASRAVDVAWKEVWDQQLRAVGTSTYGLFISGFIFLSIVNSLWLNPGLTSSTV